MYIVVLKSLKNSEERIALTAYSKRENAEIGRKNWRKVLGGKHWTVDRRPGADTLDHLLLTVEEIK